MFTGLVVECGRIAEVESSSESGGLRLRIEMSTSLAKRLPLGASLAVSGCCLTIVERSIGLEGGWVDVELSQETLECTTLGQLSVGDTMNLEPALEVGQALGGHWVQGHIDGTTELLERVDEGEFSTFWWQIPAGLEASFVEKGSVTVDGVSLTVAGLLDDRFSVALIPHTLEETTLGGMTAGCRSNIEVDILSKYVDRALTARLDAKDPG